MGGKNSQKSEINHYEHFLNLYLFGEQDIIENYLKENKCEKKENFYVDKNLGFKIYDKSENICSEIQNNIENGDDKNVLLILLKNDDETKIINITDSFSKKSTLYIPQILIACKKEENKALIDNKILSRIKNYELLSENFEIINYKEIDDINKKLYDIFCYFNNIGDISLYPNEFFFNKEIKSSSIPYQKKMKYKATFNIICIGRKGSGKSTLINILLNKKRVREGFNSTNKISNYLHDDHPILLHDTPGFENEDLQKMIDYFKTYKFLYGEGKNQFHLVLYLINASDGRSFSNGEIELIKNLKQLNLPIFFVCTRTKKKEYAKNNEEIIKVTLKRKFQNESTELIKNIYSCHLKNEKDNIYQKFGIDDLLNGIHEYFQSHSFPSLFFQNNKDIKSSLQDYIKKITQKYKNILLKFQDDNSDLHNNISVIKMYIEHLIFEMNINDEIKYDFDIDYMKIINDVKESLVTEKTNCLFDWMKIGRKQEIEQIIEQIEKNTSEKILDYFNNNELLKTRCDEKLNEYKNAINSLLYIKETLK